MISLLDVKLHELSQPLGKDPLNMPVLGASKREQELVKGQAVAVVSWWRMIPFKEEI